MVKARQQCHYSIIRFMPHVETGEFANIGVILVAPEAGFLDFCIETKRHARVTNFFDTIAPEFYRNVVATLVEELGRVKKLLAYRDHRQAILNFGRTEPALSYFVEATRMREGILNFSEPRVLLAEDPKAALRELFGHYVERNFVAQRYRETVLEDEMKAWLQTLRSHRKYVRRQFDDGLYRASFPFVEVDAGGEPLKILKPFFLGQRDPTAIIDHGVKWKTSVERLRRARVLPERVLFAVEGPREGDNSQLAAFKETLDSLSRADIDVLPFDARERILHYAELA